MAEAPHTLPSRQRLQLKILLPMGIGVLIFLGLYIGSTSWYLDRQLKRDLKQQISEIDANFQNLLDQHAHIMYAHLEQLAKSSELRQLMLQQDRNRLYEATEPTFKLFLEHLRISHFYFINPDQSTFLRVHNPTRFNDQIHRYTLQQAVRTQKAAHGIELGRLGTFTLRAVLPWYQDDKLLGYLELGKEIDLLLNNFFQHEKTVLTLTIDKENLDRHLWEVGARMLGKNPADWELLANEVIVQTSIPALLPEILKILETTDRTVGDDITLAVNNQRYQGHLLPLRDASDRQVGEFLALQDVTLPLDDYRNIVIIFAGLYLLATGGFLFFTARILGRTEKQLAATDRQLLEEMNKVQNTNIQLETEIDERKAAETALNRIHNELEERVQERTEQLWLSLEQTRQTRKQLTDIISSVNDALLVTDLDGNLLLLNPRAEQLFRCQAETCIGQPLKNIIQDPEVFEQMDEALRQQFSEQRIEFEQISSDLHKPVFYQARTSVITGSKNEAAGMIFLIHNISHEREMERIKSEFISTAVHELSTPLTAVMGYSELLLSEQKYAPEERHEFITIINEKSEFLARLVGEILDISRIESGKPLELHKEEHTVTELFERPIRHFRHFSADHPFAIEIKNPDFKLRVDREKIWQVMENLCSNAVKYSPAGGNVSIRGEAVDKGYQVTIIDEGLGLTEDQSKRVFEKFYRCNQSDTSVGGTGLGMTIVEGIIEAHNGKIWLDSELGLGTSVHFVLPTEE